MNDTSAVASRRAGRRGWMGLAVLALPCMLYSMDLTVLNLAVPSLSAALAPTATQLLWIVDIYGFLVAGSLITMGTLGDRIGRRRMLLIGAAAFGGVSVLAALSVSAEMLIATRALLRVAGATIAPSKLSLKPSAGRLDLLSAGLSLGSVLAVIYGLKRIAVDGPGWLAASSAAAGLAMGVAFVRRQRRLADPLIDLALFRIPAFRASLATYLVATFVVFGATSSSRSTCSSCSSCRRCRRACGRCPGAQGSSSARC